MTQNLSERQATIDDLCINTMRTLAIDAIEAAKSGHPGAPMGLAPAAYVLWTRILKHNPRISQGSGPMRSTGDCRKTGSRSIRHGAA